MARGTSFWEVGTSEKRAHACGGAAGGGASRGPAARNPRLYRVCWCGTQHIPGSGYPTGSMCPLRPGPTRPVGGLKPEATTTARGAQERGPRQSGSGPGSESPRGTSSCLRGVNGCSLGPSETLASQKFIRQTWEGPGESLNPRRRSSAWGGKQVAEGPPPAARAPPVAEGRARARPRQDTGLRTSLPGRRSGSSACS